MKIKRSGFFFFRMICLLAFSIALEACSPSSLFNSGDSGIRDLPTYHHVNHQCSGLDLSSSRLTVTSARQLVDCLDAQGALGGVARLVRAMSNDELAPVLTSFNRSLLDNPRNLFELERSFNDLDSQAKLSDALGALAGLLGEQQAITQGLGIFRNSFAPTGTADPLLLKALTRLARELTVPRVGEALDLGLILADSPAFSSLWDELTLYPTALPPSVAQGLVAYGQSGASMGRDLLKAAIDGTLFQFVDPLLPDDAAGLGAQVPRLGSLLDASLASQGAIAGGLSQLFGALARPVTCFQDARAMHQAPLDLMREWSVLPDSQARSFIERDKLMQLYVTAPLCAYPSAVAQNYPALMRLAETPAIEPLADVVRALYGVGSGNDRPMANLVIRDLGDPSFVALLPALSELQARGAWQDLLLLAMAARLHDHSELTELLQALLDPLPGAGTTTSYDVLVQGFTRAQPADLTSLLQSFKTMDPGLAAAMRSFRAAYYVNDTHPLIDLFQSAVAAASSDPALINSLLRISARAEFSGALHELALMGRTSDGRLRDLLQTTFSLFHQFSVAGTTPVQTRSAGQYPAPLFETRHRLASRDLKTWQLPDAEASFGSCAHVDLSTRWDALGVPGFDGQLDAVATCVGADGNYAELASSLELLTREQTTQNAQGDPTPESLHALLIQAVDVFQYTRPEAAILADWTIGAVTDGRLLRALDAIPIWVHQGVVRPLVQLAAPLISDVNARAGLRRLGVYAASVLRRDDAQAITAYLDDVIHTTPSPAPPTARAPYDTARLLRWISNKECSTLPGAQDPQFEAARQARLKQILGEYENAVVSSGPIPSGALPTQWTLDQLRATIAPILKQMANPAGDNPVIPALLHFVARLKDPTQFPPGFLENWLRTRANDRRIISYMYPGEAYPRVRLVNTLDRLSLIVANADLDAPEIGMNIALHFLGEMAEAWGDVPFAQRPPEIQAKFPDGGATPCMTLAQALDDINATAQAFYSLSGFSQFPACGGQVANPNDPADVQSSETTDPVVVLGPTDPPTQGSPELRARMFNLAETFSVLEEELNTGGMALLRDMFFDLYYTGPKANRDSDDELKNNLGIVTYFVNAGLLRQVGQLMADTSPNDPAIHGFFGALIDGAATPETAPVFEALFAADSDQTLIWNTLSEILKLQTPADIANAKTIGLKGMAVVDQLGRLRTPNHAANELLGPLMRDALPIVVQDSAFLSRHTDLLGDLMTWQSGADFVRVLSTDQNPVRASVVDLLGNVLSDPQRGLDALAIVQSVQDDAQGHQAWTGLRTAWDGLDQVPAYTALHVGDLGRQALKLLEGREHDGSPLPPDQAALSRKLLLQSASLLERDNMNLVDQLLSLASRQPQSTFGLLDATGSLIQNGEIPHLLDLIQTNLGPAI